MGWKKLMHRQAGGALTAAVLLFPAGAAAQRQGLMPECTCSSGEAMEANREGLAAHGRRSLQEASEAYTRALRAAPPRGPSAAERELILRFAPRAFVTPDEPFALTDAAAVLHPSGNWIAYHFFWADDIDFPNDNDPCDHEVMWVQLGAQRSRVSAYYTYFHGRIVAASPEDVADANRHGGRPAVVVQWGKHGTMPRGWRSLPITPDAGDVERKHMTVDRPTTLETYNRATWEKLSTAGRQDQDSPLARGWPVKFRGSFADFTNYSRLVDPADLLRKKGYMSVSCLNNAVINRHFLRYNFAAKTEWPEALCAR